MHDAETIRLARRLKAEFQSRKSKQIGRAIATRVNEELESWWIRGALLCQELEADPFKFIEAAFLYSRKGPHQNAIGGEAHRGWYDMYLKDTEEVRVNPNPSQSGEAIELSGTEADFMRSYKNFWDLMWAYYRSEEVTEEIMQNMVIWGQGDVHPVIRTILAHNEPYIQKTVGEEARWMIANDPGIERACRKLRLPIELVLDWKEVPGDA